MKAIQIVDGKPEFTEVSEPSGDGVKIKVVASSICGTDVHLLAMGAFVDGRVIGHEYAGYTPDGTAVAVEPVFSCGNCGYCEQGLSLHCVQGLNLSGIQSDGGMAEYVVAPERALIPLPDGLDISTGNLVEPIAISIRGLHRARVNEKDRILIIGSGPIGLATAAVLGGWGIRCDISARYPHQQTAAEALGARVGIDGRYDLVVDAVGSEATIKQSIKHTRPEGRILMLGMFFEPVAVSSLICTREVDFITSSGYKTRGRDRSFVEAARILAANPGIAQALISHRFSLEAASEAFATAADRKSGAIKVVFNVHDGVL